MKSHITINLADIEIGGSTGEHPTVAVVPLEIDNPIVLLCTSSDPSGSPFDLRKGMLFRDGHTFQKSVLRQLSLFIQKRRSESLKMETASEIEAKLQKRIIAAAYA